MAKYKQVMNGKKFQDAVKALPANPGEGVDFVGFRANKKGDKDNIFIGLYVGSGLTADYNTDKKPYEDKKVFDATLIKGTIYRSPKHPKKKLVVESPQKSIAKEVGKAALKANNLKYAIVAIEKGEPEPDVSAEEMSEMDASEVSESGSTTTSESESTSQKAPQRPKTPPTTPRNTANAPPQQQPQQPPPRPTSGAPVHSSAQKSPEGQKLLGRVRTLNAHIKELEPFDKVEAGLLTGEMKTILNELGTGDTPQVHQKVDGLLKPLEGPRLWKARAHVQKGKQRGALHQSMTKRFQIVEQTSFVRGEGARVEAKINPGGEDKAFTTLSRRVTECEHNRDANSYKMLEVTCKGFIEGLKNNPNLTPADQARIKYAKDQLAAARLAQQAIKYKALGDPSTWDDTKEAQAGELQATYFFEEGALHAKEGEFGANPLGNDSGDNGSWWIRQVDPGDPEGKGSRKFIFKPSDAEGDPFMGFTPGSLAPREVMAKTLNDIMSAEGGLDIGVCPTTLADIDSSKLPDQDGKVSSQPSRLGSMQQLAESEGTALDVLLGGKQDEFKKIPKENKDQIVVFDIINGALDRHRGNLMVGDGPDGTKKFVPIDHGLTMPGKTALYLNRRRATQNHALLEPDLDPNNTRDQPLSQSVKEGLLKLKPSEIAAQMKKARDDQRNAHPGMDDGMPDESIQIMQRSMEFLQKAAQRNFSVADLITINSKYCIEIQEAQPNQLDALLDKIERELPQDKAALTELEQIFPKNPQSILADDRFGDQLRELGWCLDLLGSAANIWAKENPALALRIIKNKMVNPALQQRINALVQQLGGPDVIRELKINLDDKPIALFDRLQKVVKEKDPLQKLDEPQLHAQYDQLGGENMWKQIRTQFALSESLAEKKAKKARMGKSEPANRLRNQIETLKAWPAFQQEGGMDEFLKLSGLFDFREKGVSVPEALDRLRGAKADRQAIQGLVGQGDLAVAQQKLTEAQTAVGQLPRATARPVFTNKIQSITNQLTAPNADLTTLLPAAVKIFAEVTEAVTIYNEWDKKMPVFKQAVSILTTKGHPRGATLIALLGDANKAFDEGRAVDARTLCVGLDKSLKDAATAKT